MFESIAMICYLSMVEPQEFQQDQLNPSQVVMKVYTGNGGDEPEDDPDIEKKRD